jgi:hypothetical protein
MTAKIPTTPTAKARQYRKEAIAYRQHAFRTHDIGEWKVWMEIAASRDQTAQLLEMEAGQIVKLTAVVKRAVAREHRKTVAMLEG